MGRYEYNLDLNAAKNRIDQVDQHQKAMGKGGSGDKEEIRWYGLPKDTTEASIRFLPPWPGSSNIAKLVTYHYNCPTKDYQGKDKTDKVLCLASHDMPCPICELLQSFSHKLNVDDWAPNTRAYFNVLVVRDPSEGGKNCDPKLPYIFTGSFYDYKWVMERMLNPDIGVFIDPYQGNNVLFKRKKDGGAFDRNIAIRQTAIAGSEEEIESVLEKMYDLDKIWRSPDDNFVKKVHDSAKALKDIIENRVLTLNSGHAPVTQRAYNNTGTTMAPASAPASSPSTPPPASAPAASSGSTKPSGAPECFANPEVFVPSAARTGNNGKKCILCSFDFSCEVALKKAGHNV